jgi:hypothetical protein
MSPGRICLRICGAERRSGSLAGHCHVFPSTVFPILNRAQSPVKGCQAWTPAARPESKIPSHDAAPSRRPGTAGHGFRRSMCCIKDPAVPLSTVEEPAPAIGVAKQGLGPSASLEGPTLRGHGVVIPASATPPAPAPGTPTRLTRPGATGAGAFAQVVGDATPGHGCRITCSCPGPFPCRQVARFSGRDRASWWFPTRLCCTVRAKRCPASPLGAGLRYACLVYPVLSVVTSGVTTGGLRRSRALIRCRSRQGCRR